MADTRYDAIMNKRGEALRRQTARGIETRLAALQVRKLRVESKMKTLEVERFYVEKLIGSLKGELARLQPAPKKTTRSGDQ